MLLKQFFSRNETFSYEALRAAGYCNYGGGDLSEIFNICSRIRDGDEQAWMQEWRAAADRAEDNACTSASKGNKQSSFTGYLRASNYYRTAEFFRRDRPFEDTEAHALFTKAQDTFLKAMEHGSHRCEEIQIPYEDTTLPGYLFLPSEATTNLKTIVFNGGYDSTKEESWFAIAAPALDRGYAVIAFDGPGQGAALRDNRLFFRHDWENVLTPVMDYVLKRPEVDAERVVIFGWSMGGYLVARGATSEHRAAALILDDGVYDFGAAFRSGLPWPIRKLIDYHYDGLSNGLLWNGVKWSIGMKWGLLNGLWTFGIDSPAEFFRATSKYTLQSRCALITTPCLILDAPDDHFLQGQPKILAEHIKCRHSFLSLDKADGGELHCHQGAFGRLHQVIFDFLAEEFPE